MFAEYFVDCAALPSDAQRLEGVMRAALQVGSRTTFNAVVARLSEPDMDSGTRRRILGRVYLVAKLRLKASETGSGAVHEIAVCGRSARAPSSGGQTAADVMWAMRLHFVKAAMAPRRGRRSNSLQSFCGKLLYKLYKCQYVRAATDADRRAVVLRQFISLISGGSDGVTGHLTLKRMLQLVPLLLHDETVKLGLPKMLAAHVFCAAVAHSATATMAFISTLPVFVTPEFNEQTSLGFAEWRVRAGDEAVDAAENMVRDFFAPELLP